MADARIIRVFISSPSDVRPERGIAARVVQRLAREFSYYFKVEPVLWEREPLLASDHFQDLIIPPHQTDIVVVVLWSKLGMTLPQDKYLGPLSKKPVTGTEWEFEDALAGYRERQVPDLLLYHKRADITVKLGDRAALEEQQRQAELVEDFMRRWFRDAEGKAATAASRSFMDGAALEAMLEDHLRGLLRKRLPGARSGEEPATIHWHQGSPYRGLEAFGPEHEPIFFGRTRARNEIRELLARQVARGSAFVLVMGASGSGKSSLVKAGVLPQLCAAGMVGHVALVRYAITRPGARTAAGNAVQGLAAALIEGTALPELAPDHPVEELANLLGTAPAHAVHPIRRGLLAAGRTARLTDQGDARLLLVVDQLEELFTAEDITAADRERYVAALAALAASGLVWVIATLRSDFFDRLERLPVLATLAGGETKYLLTPPDRPEIGEIIRQPAREAGLRFEVDEKSGRRLDEAIREAAGDSGSLPLLEYLLDQMWNRRTEGGLLTHAAYDELGGLEGAIGRRAEAVLASHPPDVQAVLPRLLRALVTIRQGARAAATTRHAPIEQFKAGGAERRLIAALLDPQARLLVADGDRIRVAHEALLTHWPRAQAQIAEDRSDLQLRTRLEEAVARWRAAALADRDSLLLAPGLPLSEAEDLLKRRGEELDAGLIAYIEDSAVAARRQADLARQQRDRALLQEARVVSVLARQSIAAGDAQTGMLAAIAVLPQNRDDTSRPLSPEAVMALYDGWLRNREVMTLVGHRDVVLSAAFSPDGRRVVTASQDGTARLWRVDGEHPTSIVLGGHKGSVSSAVFSPDGSRVVTTSEDCTARLWDVGGEEPMSVVLEGHKDCVWSASFSRDSHRVVTASKDGTARVWGVHVTLHRPTAVVLEGHENDVRSAAFSPDGDRVVTASWDGTARLWDLDGRRTNPVVLAGHKNIVDSAVFSPDGRCILTSSQDGTARLWDLRGEPPVATVLEGHKNIVSSASFSPGGRRVATTSWDNTVRLWNISGEHPVATVLEGHKRRVWRAEFSADGHRLATAAVDGTTRIWDVGGERPTAVVLEGHLGGVLSAAFSPDGHRVVTASMDYTARLWDVTGERPAALVLKGPKAAASHAAFSADGRRLVTSYGDGTARLWDLDDERPTARVLEGHRGSVRNATFSPDGGRVVTASEDGTARLWDARSDGRAAIVLEGHGSDVRGAAFSPDGRRVVTASMDGTARIWDVSSGRPTVAVLEGHKEGVWGAAFSPDGSRVVTAGRDGTAWLWDVSANRPTAVVLEGHKSDIGDATFSPDGRHVLTASDDRTARLWDLSGEHPVAVVLHGHTNIVLSAAFSPDGRRVITGSMDGTARLWDISGERPTSVVLEGHKYNVRTAAFSPDGRLVATASTDGTARLWWVNGERMPFVVLEHPDSVRTAEFSRDGRRLVTTSGDGTVRVWPILGDEHEFITLARRSLTRSLTPAQQDSLGLSPSPRPFVDRNQVTGPPRPEYPDSDDKGHVVCRS